MRVLSAVSGERKFVYLRFANADARLWGLDLSGFLALGRSDAFMSAAQPRRLAAMLAAALMLLTGAARAARSGSWKRSFTRWWSSASPCFRSIRCSFCSIPIRRGFPRR